MRWGSLVCIVAFHKFRSQRDDEGGGVDVCVRCGKILYRSVYPPRDGNGAGGPGGGLGAFGGDTVA